ncbi:hypothetical protein BC833DRAFT_656525 [Globomyces pollinis-pini]|nr:hypothetical protein BC833DRAFT_656525 [Globomyces pollinis-pini]
MRSLIDIHKCSNNDYSFLNKSKLINENHFTLQTEVYREAYRRKFDIQDLSVDQCLEKFKKEYKEVYENSDNLFDSVRLDTLNDCFTSIIESTTTFKPLLAAIHNEYLLIIISLINKMEEKKFLRTKVQHLICNLATGEQLRSQQDILRKLTSEYEHHLKTKKLLEEKHRAIELQFFETITKLYDKEVQKWVDLKNEKKRNEFWMLGRWNFAKDWLMERAEADSTLKDLATKINENPESFRKIISEEEEILPRDFDSVDIRRLKIHVDDQRKASKSFQREMDHLGKKQTTLVTNLKIIEAKIKDVQELINVKQSIRNNRTRITRRESISFRPNDFAALRNRSKSFKADRPTTTGIKEENSFEQIQPQSNQSNRTSTTNRNSALKDLEPINDVFNEETKEDELSSQSEFVAKVVETEPVIGLPKVFFNNSRNVGPKQSFSGLNHASHAKAVAVRRPSYLKK